MEISLLPWLIAWAILTTIDVILAVYRAHLASHEVTGIRIEDTEADLPEVQDLSLRADDRQHWSDVAVPAARPENDLTGSG